MKKKEKMTKKGVEMKSTLIDDRNRLGLRIKQLRKEQGLTQFQLAEKTGLKYSNLSRIERGKHSTGQYILSSIATALGKRIDII